MITKLCEIARTYHTDKAGWYTPFYDLLFCGDRRERIRKVLEVGIGTKETMSHVPGYLPGASLFMWRDYFPDAEIWGVDIDKRAVAAAGAATGDGAWPGTHCVHSDSSDPAVHQKLPRDFDLIVDDGSHNPEVQWQTFLNLFPLTKDGGLYIIEDAEDWRGLSERLEGYSHQIVLAPSGHATGKLILVRK